MGLLVKKIGDVVDFDLGEKEPPPANMKGIQGEYFTGVYKMENSLIGVLDIDKVLSSEE